jgi:2-polyprenyl-3-methyl-5-hydroxy-6-metoxy-1,4-benzoquinol methylase
MEPVGRVPRDAAADGPTFDAATFDRSYFAERSNYGGRYDWYNPPHKIAGYLREVRALRASGSLIDVGCAFGRFLQEARRVYACEGVDISDYVLDVARQRLPDLALHREAIQTFQIDRTFDVVTCFDVLEHVPDLDGALRSLRRLIAPGGVLALAVPVYDSPLGWAFRVIDRDPTHFHRLSRWEWLRRLKEAGLEPIVFKGILRVPLPGSFIHVMGTWLRRCSSAIFVVCRHRP